MFTREARSFLGALSGCYGPFLLTLCFLLLGQCVPAQAVIRGAVTDGSGKPVTGANVLLLDAADSALVRGTIAGDHGAYSLSGIRPGNYLISFSGVGFKQVYSPLPAFAGKGERDMGTQVLERASADLATVTVSAKKPLLEQKIDRLVINVQANITAAGSTVLDVLERSPGVIVDRQNNAISLSGKNGVVVIINGKINRMPIDAVIQMLAGMSAGNVEKIELITTPPANMDAEGNAGYINIVLKQNTLFGTNGSLSLSMGYGNRDMPQASINLNHRQGKINLYGDYSFSRIHAEQDWDFYHRVTNQGQATEIQTYTYRNTVQRNHNLRMGLDYQASKGTVIGVLVMGYNNKWTMGANNNTHMYINGKEDTLLTIANTEKNLRTNYGININLQHTVSEKERFSFNTDYIYYGDDNPVGYLYAYYDGGKNFLFNRQTRSGKITPLHIWVNAADYYRRLGKEIELEAGLKSSISSFNNNVRIDRLEQNNWIKDPAFSSRYALKEDVEAAYASLSVNLDAKTTFKGGLRYEYTNSNLGSDSLKNIVDRHYGYLFPSGFITRKLNDNNTLGLSYSRRITRPTFNDLAPFVIFIDPNTFFSGNPALQPALSDAIKLDHTYKKFVFSVSYTYEKSPIADFNPTIDSTTNIETLSAINLENNKIFAVTLSLPLDIRPWWNLYFSATGVSQQTNAIYTKSPLRLTQQYVNIVASQTFRLPRDISIELSGVYFSPSLFGIQRTDAFGSLDIGAQKKLRDGKSTFRLAYTNMLNTMFFRISIDQPDRNLVIRDRLMFTFPAVKLTYTRSFGNDKLKAKRERSTGAEDEQGRAH